MKGVQFCIHQRFQSELLPALVSCTRSYFRRYSSYVAHYAGKHLYDEKSRWLTTSTWKNAKPVADEKYRAHPPVTLFFFLSLSLSFLLFLSQLRIYIRLRCDLTTSPRILNAPLSTEAIKASLWKKTMGRVLKELMELRCNTRTAPAASLRSAESETWAFGVCGRV